VGVCPIYAMRDEGNFCSEMQGEKRERCLRLCELNADQQDADKQLEWVKDIIRLCEEKEEKVRRLKRLDCSAQNGEAA
jgi:hypothetical protein